MQNQPQSLSLHIVTTTEISDHSSMAEMDWQVCLPVQKCGLRYIHHALWQPFSSIFCSRKLGDGTIKATTEFVPGDVTNRTKLWSCYYLVINRWFYTQLIPCPCHWGTESTPKLTAGAVFSKLRICICTHIRACVHTHNCMLCVLYSTLLYNVLYLLHITRYVYIAKNLKRKITFYLIF